VISLPTSSNFMEKSGSAEIQLRHSGPSPEMCSPARPMALTFPLIRYS
jgi:hypothetical protein